MCPGPLVWSVAHTPQERSRVTHSLKVCVTSELLRTTRLLGVWPLSRGALKTCHTLFESSVSRVSASGQHASYACGHYQEEHFLWTPPLVVLGPPHTHQMCVETRVGAWPNLPYPCLVHACSLSICHSQVLPFQVRTPGAQGVVCNFYAALRWHTEGAQGVLSCPLGITELTRACECRC